MISKDLVATAAITKLVRLAGARVPGVCALRCDAPCCITCA